MYIGAASAGNALFSGTSVAANDTVIINLSQVLGTGEILRALSGTNAALNLTVSGVENDGPLAQNAMYIADNAITSAKIADGAIVNADINASAAIDKTKISGTAVTVADTGTVTSTMILDGTILNADINASAAIDQSKIASLTSDLALKAPLASPTLTGTPLAPTASAGTNTTQIATMASRPWNVAWGVMAYNSSTSSDATVSSEEVQITGSSFTAVSGRLYKISYFEPDVYSNSSSSYISLRIRLTNISGTVLQEMYEQSEVGGVTNRFMNAFWVGTLTAGSTNVVGTLAFNVGTATAGRFSSSKAFLLVEDIGPA
jgi:hypothetical protein